MGGQPVEDIRRDGGPARHPGDADNDADGQRIKQHDEQPIEQRLETVALPQEEGDRHGDHGEHAGRKEHQKAPQNGFQNELPKPPGLTAPGKGHFLREVEFLRIDASALGAEIIQERSTDRTGSGTFQYELLAQLIRAGSHRLSLVLRRRVNLFRLP